MERSVQEQKAEGYKFNPVAPFIWLERTRLRTAVFGLLLVALGAWWLHQAGAF